MKTKRGSAGTAARRGLVHLAALATVVAVSACDESAVPTGNDLGSVDELCSIPSDQILSGGPGKDGIPALTDPPMVGAAHGDADYLRDTSRVIGLEVDSEYYAVPIAIMWWHEIVNLNFDGLRVAVTHCPLTGSSLAFDRSVIGGAEFGVSGLLYLNNVILYDRTSEESLWPQMERGARCGPRDGTSLDMYPVVEMRWREWRTLHPGTQVISKRTGHARNYETNPYDGYAQLHSEATLHPLPFEIDDRRPPKERVLAVPVGNFHMTYPFGELAAAGSAAAIHDEVGGRSIVVLWSTNGRSAMAFDPMVDGQSLTFQAMGGTLVDEETGSEWTPDGLAVAGPLAGARLPAVDEAYVAYWFAWSAFNRGASIWVAGS